MAVFTRLSDHTRPDGTIIDEEIDGVPVRSLVNDFKGGTFREHYLSPPVRAHFEQMLREWRPDVVHVQHLIGLSADLPVAVRALGFRVVATAHDYWYVCQRVMFQHRDGSVCQGPAHADCFDCMMRPTTRLGAPLYALQSLARNRLRPTVKRPLLTALGHVLPGAAPPPPDADLDPNGNRWRAMRAALDAFERIVTPSQFVIDEFARQGLPLPPERTSALALGIDTSELNQPIPPPRAVIAPDAPLRLGFIGQLMYHKGPHTLLQAMRLVPDLPIEGHFYGRRWPELAYDAQLSALFAAEPRATYHGRFPAGTLADVLGSFDVLVVPSTCLETFGIATREGFLAGRPVLSTDRGALPEAIRAGEDGLLVPAEDPGAMAAALRRLVTEPALLARVQAGALVARQRVKSMADYAAEIEAHLYERRSGGSP